jgi:hypothetical protein
MVDSRITSVAVREIADSNLSETAFKGLLSDEILSKNENSRISYGHNILFDFGYVDYFRIGTLAALPYRQRSKRSWETGLRIRSFA